MAKTAQLREVSVKPTASNCDRPGGAGCYARRVPEPEDGKDVLGNLPRRRPGIESKKRAKARSTRKKSATARPKPAPAPQRSELDEVERLARAGVGLAAGAAATGLKLAGRAVGGLGRVVGRR
jgi:hypothetical protein